MSGEDEFKIQLELEKREEDLKQNADSTFNDPYVYKDPNDGTLYEWNHEKQAWFPKIDDDFIAAYQANYGVSSSEGEGNSGSTTTANQAQQSGEQTQAAPKQIYHALRVAEKRKANEAQNQGWFEVDDDHNTNVYVSNLPLDITEDEFKEQMSKCGIIMKDIKTGKLKIKLYQNAKGEFKGDGRCCYIKVESVDLALKILDGFELRGRRMKVERAKFQMKGEYDPSKKPKKLKSNEKKKVRQLQEKLLDWRPDRPFGSRLRCEKTVILKNMFVPEDFTKSPELILEYKSDLREECSKFGEVKKVLIYDSNEEGVASVTFKEAEEADVCIQALNNRWFGGRQLSAAAWDGRTKYIKQESNLDEAERLKQWHDFLEQDD